MNGRMRWGETVLHVCFCAVTSFVPVKQKLLIYECHKSFIWKIVIIIMDALVHG